MVLHWLPSHTSTIALSVPPYIFMFTVASIIRIGGETPDRGKSNSCITLTAEPARVPLTTDVGKFVITKGVPSSKLSSSFRLLTNVGQFITLLVVNEDTLPVFKSYILPYSLAMPFPLRS